MKKTGILHPEIMHLITGIGHTDCIVLADKGYPVPDGPHRINIGLTENIPTVPQVLRAIEQEMTVDRIICTEEMRDISPDRLDIIQTLYPDIRIDVVSHLQFKEMSRLAKGVIKTGDTCPFANLMLVSG